MPHDSSMTTSKSDLKMIVINSPRSSTISFVRQFARSCVTVNGMAFNQLMVNRQPLLISRIFATVCKR